MSVHGGGGLYASAKVHESVAASQLDRLNDIVPRLKGTGQDPVPRLLKEVRRQMCGFQRLRHRVRSVEKALQYVPRLSEGGAHLKPDPRRGQAVSAKLHRLARSGDISAGVRHAAAGVLDKRAGR